MKNLSIFNKYLSAVILTLIISNPLLANSNFSNYSYSSILSLFFLISYFFAITLFYKRFICKGKYYYSIVHLVLIIIGLILLPYAWIYLFFIEPILIYFDYKSGKTITSLSQLGNNNLELKEIKDLSIITQNDSSFNKNEFIDYVNKVFVKIENCWNNNDFLSNNYIISDGLKANYKLITDILNNNKLKIEVKNIELNRTRIIGVIKDSYYETIFVAISGIEQKRVIYDDKNSNNLKFLPDNIDKILRFTRTINKDNNNYKILDGYCPKCGSTINNLQSIYCEKCKSDIYLNSWLLTGIAPKYLYINKNNILNEDYYKIKNIPGLDDLKNKDPFFSIYAIEDKIQLIFYKTLEAIKLLDSSPLYKLATDNFINNLNAYGKIEEFPIYTNNYIKLINIKSIIINKNQYDKIAIKITWCGDNSNKQLPQKIHESIFIICRKTDVKTNLNSNFFSGHCSNCGFNIINSNLEICPNCNFNLKDKCEDWLLERIISETNFELSILNDMIYNSKTIFPNDLNKINLKNLNYTNEDLIKMTIAVMLSDNKIDKNELKIIYEIAKKKGIKKEFINDYINEISSQPDPINYTLNNSTIKKDVSLLLILVDIAASDGKITDDEAELLYKICDKMQIHRKLLYDMINNAYQNNSIA